MPSESTKLFRAIAVDYEATGAGSLTLSTDLPGGAIATRVTQSLPATTGREVYKFPVNAKGNIPRVRLTPNAAGSLSVYRVGLYCRRLGRQASDWQWYWIDVVPTQDWMAVKVPIPETPSAWTPVKLNIPPTPEEWTTVKVPVPETPAGFTALKVPMEDVPEISQWAELAMDEDQPVTGAA